MAANAFITGLLRGIGAPATTANIDFLSAWINREGGGGQNNPLNTTERMTGSTSLAGNSAGVQNYTDINTGIQATVKTLLNGRYSDVLSALRSGKASANATYAGLSTWSGGGYNTLTGVSTTTGSHTAMAQQAANTPSASTGDIRTQVERNYGYLAAFLNDKEIGPILIEAIKGGWDQARLEGALYKTKWWQTHSDATRSFDAQTRLDPATQKAQIAQQVADVTSQARQLGLIIDPKRLSQIAVDTLRFGWDAQQIRNAMVQEGRFDYSGKTGSAALTLRDNLGALASQYMVPVAGSTMAQWVKNVTKGDVSQQDFEGYLKEQAKSLFPGMSAAIDSGVTPQQYVEPYKQIAAQTLELPPDQVNFMDPKWGKALFQVDPKTGARTSMSLADWQNTLRTDPIYGYDKTQQAQSSAADLITNIQKTFG